MNNNAWVWWLVGAIIVIGGGYFIWHITSNKMSATDSTGAAMTDTGNAQSVDVNDAGPDANTSVEVTGSVGTNNTTVTYDGSSFTPSTVTISKGGTVTFKATSGTMWVASDPHPAHSGYDGTSRTTHCAAGYTGAAPFDQCAPGTTFTMTFNKTGTFGYHNHLLDEAHGTVIVQ
jgi:plastocyanin